MFIELADIIAENGKGIHAFRKCAGVAREKAAASPDQAVAYFLLAALAEDFIESNERMAITVAHTIAAFEQFSDTAAQLEDVFGGGKPAEVLAAVNRIASDLASRNA
ncbi:hypothetical protein [Thalassovita aquimarina]|uniref:Uncharacterized protein n=1 Tax=Thalassovita aquimarina TaxID=2785917 RepID=A0ABS5HRC7_9RHOB|nr:hypothetical protein [Thalassovita aquimarina]MBR9651527.1 hypothetical protein [Thalassovita aquimarina]